MMWNKMIWIVTIVIVVFFIIQVPTLLVNKTFFPLEIITAHDFATHFSPPDGWKVKKIGYITARHIDGDWWEIFVELVNKERPWEWTADFVKYNTKTKEIKAYFPGVSK